MKSLRAWFRPPRHLLALFLLITLAPSTLLVALGWRWLEQDRALELQQIQERREQAADLAVSGLQQTLAAAESQLPSAPLTASEDAAAVIFTPGAVQGRLLFYPVAAAAREAPAELFAAAEEAEYRAHDSAKAASLYRGLARSSDPAVRASALIRLARVLRNSGQADAALGIYAEAARLDGPAVSGLPAGLFANWARCDLLATLGRSGDLHREAEALYADLLHSRWSLDRTAWELNIEDARHWMGDAAGAIPAGGPIQKDALPLAAGVGWLWNKWSGIRESVPHSAARISGRQLARLEGRDITILWSGDRGRLSALIAGPDFVEREWVRKLAPVLERQHARVILRDPSERTADTPEARRAASESGLPWTLAIESVNVQADLEQLAGRRRLWLAGLGTLALLVASGTWLIARAAMRELAVARLQSDFVSAVSHEFRTPLTSLRQITEILTDDRISGLGDIKEDRRRIYYQALERQTGRLHQLVESLLDFGRMEAGTSPYRLEPLDACALVRSVVEQFEREASGRGYHVELEIDGDAATIAGDREALTNALWNLLDNAVKYSLECRTVWVEVRRDAQRLAVRVRDQGLGIPHEEQAEVFRKFVRGAAAKLEGIKGTGIGLAMVDHIIRAHGGEVRLQSEPGSGSTFTLVLPCHES